MKGLINIQNEGKECSIWCFLRYLNPVNKAAINIRNFDKEFPKQLTFKGMKVPVEYSINIFGYKYKTPCRIFIFQPYNLGVGIISSPLLVFR